MLRVIAQCESFGACGLVPSVFVHHRVGFAADRIGRFFGKCALCEGKCPGCVILSCGSLEEQNDIRGDLRIWRVGDVLVKGIRGFADDVFRIVTDK
jgi:hypothetical protein